MKISKQPTAGIILAAGMSSRFNGLKALATIGDQTILSMVVNAALTSALDRIVLVLGHESDTIIETLGFDLRHQKLQTIVNPDYKEGMSASLKFGLNAVKDRYPSIMVMLGDQPLVGTRTIDRILEAFRTSPKPICQAVSQGRQGHPVCFSESLFGALLEISGDQGARQVIKSHAEQIHFMEVPESTTFEDIDNRKDLERVTEIFEMRKR